MINLDLSIGEYQKWCENLGILNSTDINRIIEDGDIKQIVNISEIWHEKNISDIARRIARNIKEKRIVLISGPSSSGKTTFATKLKLFLKVYGINSITISLDDYFRSGGPQTIDEETGKPDYDSLEAVEYDLFNHHLELIMKGEEVYTPVFDFVNKARINDARKIALHSNDIIIVEGIHALNEKITSTVSDDKKYKVYCSALTVLNLADGSKISSTDTRLMRRTLRDHYFRNSPFTVTLDMWDYIEKSAEKNIYPSSSNADVLFNSSLLYEFCIYKNRLKEIFKDASADDPHIETIKRLTKILDEFETIDENIVPRMSLMREFIGGSTITE